MQDIGFSAPIIIICIILYYLTVFEIYPFYWAHHDSNPTTYTSFAPQMT